tara:strand:- start:2284 stop:4140 length:1857 start_codon:yes stop_codon:yes gene_type:complete
MEDFYLMPRSNQGKFNPIVPPFIAPELGESTDSGESVNNPAFGEVQATATGPEAMESLFASAYSLDAGNTALAGGTFFVESRSMSTVAGGILQGGISGAASGQSGRPDATVITDWLYYARGFTFGGFTGSTSGSQIVGQPTEYVDQAGNTLTDLYIQPMDLPTVPSGSYDDLPFYTNAGRTTNKVLQITGTGTTHSANFRSAFTDMEFSINSQPPTHPDHSGISLIVQSISTTNSTHIGGSGFVYSNDIGAGINSNSASQLNLARDEASSSYNSPDQVFLNASSDLLFFFTYDTSNTPINDEQYFPTGNVLKCDFPVPVRGVSITTMDQNHSSVNVTSPSRNSYRGSRIFVEGDFTDGSTFTYIMFPRGGGCPTSTSTNSCGFMSYLALNSRSDKHIKSLYISNVWWDPVGQGGNENQSGHLPHGPVNFMGPGRHYSGDVGSTSDFVILKGDFTQAGGITGPSYPIQDDIAIKINVMPKYDRNFFQCEKRPDGDDGSYGDRGSRFNFGSYNEWRKITKNQIGKTFGRTGPISNPLDGGDNPNLGAGVLFPPAGTGDTFGVSMSFLPKGDVPGGTGGQLGVTASVLHDGQQVEAFQYEVIKGTTVDGTFIPVWKKTRTI